MAPMLSSLAAIRSLALLSIVLPAVALPAGDKTDWGNSPSWDPSTWNDQVPIAKSPQYSAVANLTNAPVAPVGDGIRVQYMANMTAQDLACIQLQQFPPIPHVAWAGDDETANLTWGQFCITDPSLFTTDAAYVVDLSNPAGRTYWPTFNIDLSSKKTLMWHWANGNNEIVMNPETYPTYTGWEKDVNLDPSLGHVWNDKFIAAIPKWLKYLGDSWIYDTLHKQHHNGTVVDSGAPCSNFTAGRRHRAPVPTARLSLR